MSAGVAAPCSAPSTYHPLPQEVHQLNKLNVPQRKAGPGIACPQGSGGYRLTQKDLARPSSSKNDGMQLEYQVGGRASVSLPPVKGPLQVQPMGSKEGAACQAVTGLVLAQPSAILCAGVHARVHICKEARGPCWVFSLVSFPLEFYIF